MSNVIMGNMCGAYSNIGKSMVITDETGVELTGIIVDNITVFDATPSDVKINKIFAGEEGVQVGVKHIPPYNYAIISTNGLCVDVYGTSESYTDKENYIAVPEYNPLYIGKYYNQADQKWYIEASFTTEWTPA